MNLEMFKHIFYRMPIVVRLLLSVFVVMMLFGTVIRLVEPQQFPSVFDGVWWAFVTGATVGYGDYVPLTVPGRIIGILLILSGGGLLTFFLTTFATKTINHENDLSEGKVSFNGKNHIVVIGWNERTRQLVEMIADKDSNQELVLIDRTLDKLQYRHYPVHFIHGDPSEDAVLVQANIQDAESVLISSDVTIEERKADINTILTTIAVRGNNQDIPINTEILTISQVENAIRAGADTVISSNDFMSTLFYHELFHKKDTRPFETVLNLLNDQQFSHIKLPEELEGSSFKKAVPFFLENHEILLGIIRDNDWLMNPSEITLGTEDTLIILSSWQ
ncbi:potassium channel family protein [Lentibacillus amyloliquefaciens]|uniref:Potassium channel protein n=1 Tax=Lentibacillus amyloliquefaciens TaxID=1472767 RepID=A0A0U4FEX3_9BACI|nr:potassium channel family protein [Lentibacillus amyloliquefaciens]ALX47230.1 potassium channel protein [Lentibacillus amyloliquefaciens]